MKTYLLIGGIGSGKSTVSALLEGKGACCIDLDTVGHGVLDDPHVVDALIEAFGEDVRDATGAIDRAALAHEAFRTPQCAVRLNAIMHPAIIGQLEQMLSQCEAHGCPIAVVEASAFRGMEGAGGALVRRADGIVAVCAPETVRIARAVASGFDEQDVRRRLAAQPTDAQRSAWADYVIDNGGTLDQLSESVEELWTAIT